MGRLSAFCIQAKLGHPMQDVHLQGGTCLPVSSIGGGYPPECRPLEKGRAKGAGWIDGMRESLCCAGLASARRIHPPAFGLPPFGLKGRRFDGQAKRLLYSGQTWTSYAGCPSSRGNLLTGILNRWGVIHQNAGPWRRAAPKAQDGCGEADDSV